MSIHNVIDILCFGATRSQIDEFFPKYFDNEGMIGHYKRKFTKELKEKSQLTHDEKIKHLYDLIFTELKRMSVLDLRYSQGMLTCNALDNGLDVIHLEYLMREIQYIHLSVVSQCEQLNTIIEKINLASDTPLDFHQDFFEYSDIEYFRAVVDTRATAQGSVLDKIKVVSKMFYDTVHWLYNLEFEKAEMFHKKDLVNGVKSDVQIDTLVTFYAWLQPKKFFILEMMRVFTTKVDTYDNFKSMKPALEGVYGQWAIPRMKIVST